MPLPLLRQKRLVEMTGVFTHFATADEALINIIENKFRRISNNFKFILMKDHAIVHTSNSAAAFYILTNT